MSECKLVVGIGNPGKGYEYTRHNLGFLVARKLAEQLKTNFQLSSFTNGLTAEGKIDTLEYCLLMPLTYVNRSGLAVKHILDSKHIDLSNILVISDDLNLEFGDIRIRSKGSSGGHNGLKSIIESAGSQQFARLRMGIGQPSNKDDVIDYVLEPFTKQEQKKLDKFVDQAASAAMIWLQDGIKKAMDSFNKRKADD